jgi:hypothetical protein
MESCHCLCTVNHPEHMGICTAEATTALQFTDFPAESPIAVLGSVNVGMCEPCKKETLEHTKERMV